ncbi:MAG: ribbon-helix-helix protein, CopG family [Xenococcaceae cyanobacterium MO_188.B29]|nr:ribbon-helix-helix protein, CopG family [Xenococcaceae cyanobacterium MO_188.B29]
MGKPQIAVRIPPSLMEKLNSYVEKTGSSKTEVIVGALAHYLGCAEAIPFGERMAEVERRLAVLEAEKRGS